LARIFHEISLVIVVDFSGGNLSTGGGAVLLRCMDTRLSLSKTAASALDDFRQSGSAMLQFFALSLPWISVVWPALAL
jgi:hypothetical protein